MFKLHNVNDNAADQYFTNTHIELSCVFKNGEEFVEVSSPSVSFSPQTPSKILQPLYLDNYAPPRPKYTIKFLTTDMTAGNYTVNFTGIYNGQPLSTSGSFQLVTITREQALINKLRTLLKDSIPSLYLVNLPDADTFKWRDGELYECINQALSAMNSSPPSTLTFTLNNIPFENHLLQISMIHALTMRGMLEIANTINYSDEISFNIDKHSKYQSYSQTLSTMWWESWKITKKDYNMHRLQSVGIASMRYPLHFIRPLSMLPNSRNTFGYY